jgi:hypothetical protein
MLLTLALLLGGCAKSYSIDVRNLTDQPVTARVTGHKPLQPTRVLKDARLAPGDRVRIGPGHADSQTLVRLEVDFEGNIGPPRSLDLAPGRTIVNVHRTEEGARGGIRLQQVHP